MYHFLVQFSNISSFFFNVKVGAIISGAAKNININFLVWLTQTGPKSSHNSPKDFSISWCLEGKLRTLPPTFRINLRVLFPSGFQQDGGANEATGHCLEAQPGTAWGWEGDKIWSLSFVMKNFANQELLWVSLPIFWRQSTVSYEQWSKPRLVYCPGR